METSTSAAFVVAALVVLAGTSVPTTSAAEPVSEIPSSKGVLQGTAPPSPTATGIAVSQTEAASQTENPGQTQDPSQSPYGGSAREIPGRIEAENFDSGGESVAYHDTDERNRGEVYRNTGVDINSQENSDNVNLGWIQDGEWVEYTVDATGGTYDIQLRVATANPGNQITVSLGGETLGTATVPHTGGWNTWQTVTIEDVTIPDGGNRILRLGFSGSGKFLYDLDWLAFTEADTDTSGDSGTSAERIPLGKRVTGELERGEAANRYTFTAEAGEAIRITSIGGGMADLSTRLYGPDGTVVATDDTNYKYLGTHGLIAEKSGTYTLEVYRSGDNPASASYELRVDTRNPDHVTPYDNTPNDDRSSALSVGDSDASLTAVLATQEEDWYAVRLDEGERLDATLTYRDVEISTGYTVSVDVVDSNGNVVGRIEGNEKRIYTRGPAPAKSSANQTFVADSAGTYYVRISGRVGGFVEYGLELDVSDGSSSQPSSQTPYPATASEVPGRIQAENFDTGGESVAYHDTDPENRGEVYRDTGVDINSQENTDNVNLGWIRDGEWVEYTVDVEPGTYDMQLRVASGNAGNEITASLGNRVLGTTTVPATGGWDAWRTVTIENVNIRESGTKVLRLAFSGDDRYLFDVDWFEFTDSTTNTVRIESLGGGIAVYELTVEGSLQRKPSAREDTVGSNRASGHVGPKRGTDAFSFEGDLTGLSISGPAAVYVDGERVDPVTYPRLPDAITAADFDPDQGQINTLRIESDGTGLAAYEFNVTGTLEATPSAREDVVSGTFAYGHLGPERGTDTFRFTGEITDFSLTGPATVYLNGDRVDSENRSLLAGRRDSTGVE